jgi:D-lactate dehydrogenase (quinone)
LIVTLQPLIDELIQIVGRRHVLTASHKTERLRKGFRSGEDEVLAVVQLWQVLKACVAAEKIVIMQAANIG